MQRLQKDEVTPGYYLRHNNKNNNRSTRRLRFRRRRYYPKHFSRASGSQLNNLTTGPAGALGGERRRPRRPVGGCLPSRPWRVGNGRRCRSARPGQARLLVPPWACCFGWLCSWARAPRPTWCTWMSGEPSGHWSTFGRALASGKRAEPCGRCRQQATHRWREAVGMRAGCL